ncbi:hypothetical protein GT755_19365 [Herbidospora sp. NEAU-GS84]|uniref:YtkA-like domain-containing protein n=1 Tax=Herbidospora solisilvae TaxID=2696284 RepID=A0A7C9JCR6_9ACTN|nr:MULTISPECIES: hypothetical protein [Herbidospora]NAS23844.1 hypothetical protein [Herbidospora solisilvae]GLX95397.1 hypothetical protein Hesp01_33470 [Herbidospora sp. NBRC 101105]
MNKALRYALAVVLAGLGLLLGAQQAMAAADGPIKLEVAGDGGRNVNVLVTWKKDGTPVTDVVAATLFAESADGSRTFGPVPLMSAPEGQNLYNPSEPLPDGEWKVTVKATKPSKAQASIKVTSGEVANVPTTEPLTTAKMAERAAAADESASELPLLQIGIIGGAVVAAVVVFFVLVRSRRAPVR